MTGKDQLAFDLIIFRKQGSDVCAKADTMIISCGLILTLTRCFFGLNPPKAASGVTVATSGPARWRRGHEVCRKEIALRGLEAFTSFLSEPQFPYL